MEHVTLSHIVARALRRHGDRIAIVDGDRTVSFAELERDSLALAGALEALGCRAGDRIALLLHNRAAFIEVECAVLRAGLVKVPINNRLTAAEVASVLLDCGARVLFAETDLAAPVLQRLHELPALRTVVTIDPHPGATEYASLLGCEAPSMLGREIASSDLCMIRYSGGTTGRPKGIMHTQGSLAAIALSVIREYGLTRDDRFLQVGHLSHGQNFVWPGLLASGARLAMMRRFDADGVLAAIERERITRLHLVPTMVAAVLDSPLMGQVDVSSLRNFVYASAPMPIERVRRLRQAFDCRISQTYTLSESAVISTTLTPEDHDPALPTFRAERLASCGREALDVQLRIVDERFADLPDGEIGEIALLSPGNMSGYWNQPELTARVLRDGWVLSGDLAYRDADGYVYLVDRKDDKIITGALNVYPKEVEDVLYAHPAVREVAVAGIPDERWGEAITAFVSLRPGCALSEAELLEHCRGRLADYKRPRRVIFLEDLPKTSVGKLSRRLVSAPYWQGRDRRVN